MKIIVLALSLLVSTSVFARISTYSGSGQIALNKLYITETDALDAAVSIENQEGQLNKLAKNLFHVRAKCKSRVTSRVMNLQVTKSHVEIKKIYIDGLAHFSSFIFFNFSCKRNH